MQSNSQPSLPDGVLDDVETFIQSVRWTATEAIAPHQYAVRAHIAEQGLAEEYDEFVRLIREHGYRARFQGIEYVYLELGDGWRYWQSRSLFQAGSNINRARVDDSEPQLGLPGVDR